MIDYLSGVLPWFKRRAKFILARMDTLTISESIKVRLETQIEFLSYTILEIEKLENDPTLSKAEYVNQLSETSLDY